MEGGDRPCVEALAGSVPFTISVGYDQQNVHRRTRLAIPASMDPGADVQATFGQRPVRADRRGSGPRRPGGDHRFGDRRQKFASWLGQRPASTWSNGQSLHVQHARRTSILPKGAFWDIDLFREVGVPRNWAIAAINPFDASLISIHYCDIPCDR